MGKYKQFKEAIANPPIERLASIEYRSHFMQMLGITAVCAILISKGFWWIIFAFIFGLGISYSQGVSAYQKYRTIMKYVKPEDPINFDNDISFTRRRSKIVKYVLGKSAIWFSAGFAVVGTVLIVPPTLNRILLTVVYLMVGGLLYSFMYFGVAYWISNPYYKNEMKGGRDKNVRKRKATKS